MSATLVRDFTLEWRRQHNNAQGCGELMAEMADREALVGRVPSAPFRLDR